MICGEFSVGKKRAVNKKAPRCAGLFFYLCLLILKPLAMVFSLTRDFTKLFV